jgi:uncharacterized protein YggE
MKRFLFALLVLPISAFADGGLPAQPYLYVVGTATIEKPADVIICKFNLVATAPEQPKANAEVQTKAGKIFAIFKERKIADADVIAENIQSRPEFEEEENHGHRHDKVIGYTVTREFETKVRDLLVFPKLVDELIALGGVQFSETKGDLTKRFELEEQLTDKALANARERAEKTAKAMNIKIESVFAISPSIFTEIQSNIFGGERVVVTGTYIPTPEKQEAPEYRLEPITLSQSAHVIYLISPAK